jgi:hypothetical protein
LQLLRDIWQYVVDCATTTDHSVKGTVRRYLNMIAGFIGREIVLRLGNIEHGINWLFTKMPQDAMTWIVSGMVSVTEMMQPFVKAVAGGSSAAWNALSSPLGLSILKGIFVVLLVCGAGWLVCEGGKRFWRWWKGYGR